MAMVRNASVSIPQLARSRFEPIFVSDEDLVDLSTFFQLTRDVCLQRLKSYTRLEMVNRWNAANPRTPDQILAFYREADLYIWELMQWHASIARRPYWDALAYLSEHFPPRGYKRVFDFGCGVGTDGLFLAERGYDVTLVDLDSPAFRFAQHRFARRGFRSRFVESQGVLPSPDGPYDIVVCFDVLEHLPDPLEAALRLVRALRPGGLLLQQASFKDDGDHPCHLHSNFARFGGLRWDIWMAGLGLRRVAGLIYRRCTGPTRWLPMSRFLFWKLTRIWPVRVDIARDADQP